MKEQSQNSLSLIIGDINQYQTHLSQTIEGYVKITFNGSFWSPIVHDTVYAKCYLVDDVTENQQYRILPFPKGVNWLLVEAWDVNETFPGLTSTALIADLKDLNKPFNIQKGKLIYTLSEEAKTELKQPNKTNDKSTTSHEVRLATMILDITRYSPKKHELPIAVNKRRTLEKFMKDNTLSDDNARLSYFLQNVKPILSQHQTPAVQRVMMGIALTLAALTGIGILGIAVLAYRHKQETGSAQFWKPRGAIMAEKIEQTLTAGVTPHS